MPSASIVYYTDHALHPDIAALCRDQLIRAARGLEIVTVGLNAACDFGRALSYTGQRGVLTMHRQILMGLMHATGDTVFMAEHDVLYSPTHFDFVPARDDTWYYNTHVWHARWPDGHSVYYDAQQVSGLCASRFMLIGYYAARIEQIERDGPNRHYEPGLKQSVGAKNVENWRSPLPNIDIRHGANLTASKWSPDDFRNKKHAESWQETDDLPGWGRLADLFRVKA